MVCWTGEGAKVRRCEGIKVKHWTLTFVSIVSLYHMSHPTSDDARCVSRSWLCMTIGLYRGTLVYLHAKARAHGVALQKPIDMNEIIVAIFMAEGVCLLASAR